MRLYLTSSAKNTDISISVAVGLCQCN